jgi:hypothetical protein
MFFLQQRAEKNMKWLVVDLMFLKARNAIHERKRTRWSKAGGVVFYPARLPFGEKPCWQAPAELFASC